MSVVPCLVPVASVMGYKPPATLKAVSENRWIDNVCFGNSTG